MNRRQFLASSAALLACAGASAGAPAALASAGLPKVTVRIEGLSKTLLSAKTIQTRSGSITRGGAPAGICKATSAQGALDVASKGKWSGTWYSNYREYEITSILGDTESGTKDYWEIFVNNVAASTGACEIALHGGQQLLFAAVPSTGSEYPLGIELPRVATAGRAFDVKVVHYTATGKAVPLAGARVPGGGTTNSRGVVKLTFSHTGTFTVSASARGYIRDEAQLSVKGSA